MANEVANRLRAVAILAAVLLNFPILGIFQSGSFVGGIPALYFYLFAVWMIILFMMGWTIETAERKNRSKPNSKG